mgnify:CR=1 FL=1
MIYLRYNSINHRKKAGDSMTDKQLRYINRLTVFVRKLLKLVPQEKREELENEFDSILLEVTDSNERND